MAKTPVKKSNVRFFHAELTFEKKSLRGGVEEAGFSAEKMPPEAENLHVFHKVCNFFTSVFRQKSSKNATFHPLPVLFQDFFRTCFCGNFSLQK